MTPRAILLALALLLAVAVFNYYVEMLWKGGWDLWMVSSGCPAMTPVFVLFLLTAAMRLPRFRQGGLTRRELLAIYAIVLVGAPVLTYEVLGWVLVKSVHYYYFARGNPTWAALFLNEVPAWFAPSDAAAVVGFFEGQSGVPWSQWAGPLAAWSSTMVALFVGSLCLVTLIQRPWITAERLSFPIAQIPLTMIVDREPASGVRAASFTTVRLFWIGAAASFALHLLSGVSERIPAMPHVNLGPIEVVSWQKTGPLAGLGAVSVVFWPWLTAIAYLIPRDLSLSIWFFWLVRLGLHVAAVAAGATPQRPEDWYSSSFPAPYYQGAGAILAMAGWVLWAARKHLRRTVAAAWRGRRAGSEVVEPMPYRWALLGLVLSGAIIVGFILVAQCRAMFALVIVCLVFAYFLVWARIRAETGLGMLIYPTEIHDLVMVPFGSRVFRLREVITLVSLRWAYSPGLNTSFEVFASTALESYKIADVAGINARRLTWAMAGGFVLSLAFGMIIALRGIYQHGWFGFGFTRSGWLTNVGGYGGSQIAGYLTDPRYAHPDINGALAVGAGALTVVLLGLMRLRFWWWPFHPVGYLAANTWGFQLWAMPFFVGWLAKTLIVRYAGLSLYRQTIPFAVGLIVGDLLNSGLWGMRRLVLAGAY